VKCFFSCLCLAEVEDFVDDRGKPLCFLMKD